MRTYGRVTDPTTGRKSWVVVSTDAAGSNDYVMLTTLCQVLLLNLNESPFFANYGLPAKASVDQQIPPDFYVARTQQQFSSFFSSLIISKVPGTRDPTYKVDVITNQGTPMQATVAF